MFVKYVTHANATAETIKTDIIALVNGQITTANDFSVNCQRSNTVVLGTYPANTYSVSNATSMTFKKEHHEYANSAYYFRIQFSGNNWVSTALAKDYTTETDTLVNSAQFPTSNTNTSANGVATYFFVVGEAAFHIGSDAGVEKLTTVLDLGKTGVTRTFTNSMLAGCLTNFLVGGSNSSFTCTFGIPYTYNIITETYGAVANCFSDWRTPGKQGLANGTLYTVENPVGFFKQETANSYHYAYALKRPGSVAFVTHATYSGTDNVYRYYYNGYSLITD